ncbi:MAG: hypothetical protein ACPGRD_10430 [Planktomarina sp.]
MIREFRIARDESGTVLADAVALIVAVLGLIAVIVFSVSNGATQLTGAVQTELEAFTVDNAAIVAGDVPFTGEVNGCVFENGEIVGCTFETPGPD